MRRAAPQYLCEDPADPLEYIFDLLGQSGCQQSYSTQTHLDMAISCTVLIPRPLMLQTLAEVIIVLAVIPILILICHRFFCKDQVTEIELPIRNCIRRRGVE